MGTNILETRQGKIGAIQIPGAGSGLRIAGELIKKYTKNTKNFTIYIMIHPNIFDHIGFWSPLLLVLVGLYELHDTIWLKPIFISLFIANIIINKLLKAIIQQPRPVNSQNLYDFEDYSGEERYGMPSGHAVSYTHLTLPTTPYV